MKPRNRISGFIGVILILCALLLDLLLLLITAPLAFFMGAGFVAGVLVHWVMIPVMSLGFYLMFGVSYMERAFGKLALSTLGSATPIALTAFTGYTVVSAWYDDRAYNKKQRS